MGRAAIQEADGFRREWVNEGMARREVVPFTCEECGGEFAETQGGICRSCGDTINLGERRGTMKKELVLIALVTLAPLPLAAFARDFNADPFHFGLGCLGTWERDAGEPGQTGDPKQFGLYLQKLTATANFAAAGVRNMLKKPMPAAELNTLAFDISGFAGEPTFGVANGYCGAGAPRFNVVSDAGLCFLGCIHGTKTQDTQTGWWEIRFDAPFSAFPGCSGVSGDVTSISIVFDEGTDQGPGNVVIDNIRINNKVVGKPTGD
jgi:hypothetical protein